MFSTPAPLRLDSQPIGRGTVQLLNGEYGNGQRSAPGEYFMAASFSTLFVIYNIWAIYRLYVNLP